MKDTEYECDHCNRPDIHKWSKHPGILGIHDAADCGVRLADQTLLVVKCDYCCHLLYRDKRLENARYSCQDDLVTGHTVEELELKLELEMTRRKLVEL